MTTELEIIDVATETCKGALHNLPCAKESIHCNEKMQLERLVLTSLPLSLSPSLHNKVQSVSQSLSLRWDTTNADITVHSGGSPGLSHVSSFY